MKKVLLAILVAITISGCASHKQLNNEAQKDVKDNNQVTDISFTEVRNYFFRNDASIPKSPLISTQKQFDSMFGAAAYMGKDGEPTKLDFDKQQVIAVVLPVTDYATTLEAKSLVVEGNNLVFNYVKKVGEKQSYSIQPVLIIAVSKKDVAGRNVFLRVKEK